MEIYAQFVVLFVAIAHTTAGNLKQYRTDYVYNSRTNAFYKLHIESASSVNAKSVCAGEGGVLMPPTANADIEQAHGMFKQLPDLGDYLWVGDDGEKHESAEEVPIIDLSPTDSSERVPPNPYLNCDVMTRRGEIETLMCFRRLPFICKVDANDAFYDRQCNVYGMRYEYYSSVHSCYAVPQVAFTWDKAFAECRAQGAHLVIINSEAEAQAVRDVLNTTASVPFARVDYFFFAGIRANRPTQGSPRVFKTIFNETLEQAGYDKWSDGEPNNYQDSEYCGSIFKSNGKYNDINCEHRFGFVCEKEVPQPSS